MDFLKEFLIPRYYSQTKLSICIWSVWLKKNKKSELKPNMNLPHRRHWTDPVQEAQRASEKHTVSKLTRFWWDLQDSQILAPLKYLQNNLLIKQNWVFCLLQ